MRAGDRSRPEMASRIAAIDIEAQIAIALELQRQGVARDALERSFRLALSGFN